METILSAIAGFVVGCVLCFFVNPHKILIFESRQKIVQDAEVAPYAVATRENKIDNYIANIKDHIRRDPKLSPEMLKDEFWQRLKNDKKAELDVMRNSLRDRHREFVGDLSLGELVDFRECYRSPMMEHLERNLARDKELTIERNQKAAQELWNLATKYYAERHPGTKPVESQLTPPTNK